MMLFKPHLPVTVWIHFVLTNVDSYDCGQKLTTDDHSSTASHWTVRWPHTVHQNLTP